MNETLTLANFVADLDFDKLPEKVQKMGYRLFYDFIGNSSYATKTETAKIVTDYCKTQSHSGKCFILPEFKGNCEASFAALANGILGHGFELDDVYMGTCLHPSGPVVAAALATAQERNASGKALLEGIIAGYEVAIRSGLPLGSSHQDWGFHATASFNVFGAAAASAKVLGLSGEQIAWALGLAGSLASGTKQFSKSVSPSMVETLHGGKSAQQGVECAMLAEKGFTGPVCSTLFSSGMSICLAGVRAELGLTGTETSMFVTIRSVTALLAVLVMDKYFKLFGYNVGIAIGVGLGAVGMFLNSIAGTNVILYWVGSGLGGICYGLCMVAAASLLMRNWFNKNRALCLGICSAGTGLSNMIFSTVLQGFITRTGVASAYRFQMIVFIAVAVLCFLLIREKPEDLGIEPFGGKDYDPAQDAKKKTGDNKPAFDHKIFLSNGYMWAMAGFVVLLGMAASPVSAHMAAALGEAGCDPTVVAAAASMAGLLMIIFKPFYGFLADKIGQKATSVIYTIVVALGYFAVFICLWAPQSFLSIAPFVAYGGHGIGGAVCTLGYTIWAMEWSKKEDYPKALKRFQSAYQLGTLIASPIPGIISDATGSYCWFYLVAVAGYLLSTGFAMVFYKILEKKRAAAGEPAN